MGIKTCFFKNKKAFSILEILIAAGLLAIVSLAIMSMMSNSIDSQRSIQAKDIQRDVMSEIANLLSNRTACLNTFGGQSPTPDFTVTILKDAGNNAKYAVGGTHDSGLVKYTEFKLENWQTDAGFTNQGLAKLNIILMKTGNIVGVKEIRQQLNLRIKLDAANKIVDCFVLGNSSEFWKSSPTNINDIYFNGGNVGIGTSSPAVKLDVDGEIKLGNSASGCDSSNEGALRYNSTLKAVEFCNGMLWVNMASGGSGTVTGSCVYAGVASGNATCPYQGNVTCPAGHTPYQMGFCYLSGQCDWNSINAYPIGFCVKN